MKHCSGYRGVIRCTTGIEMVQKAKTTSIQSQQDCAIFTYASQICATRKYRKGLRKRSKKKRKEDNESLHHVLSPLSLNFFFLVDLKGYNIFLMVEPLATHQLTFSIFYQDKIPSRLFQSTMVTYMLPICT